MGKKSRFKVGDVAVIAVGPVDLITELNDGVPDRYHYLLKGSLVRIMNCHSWPDHDDWGLQYTVEPLDDEAWADPNVGEQGTQYVYDIHLAPVVTIDTTDITEIEKFLDE